MKDKVLGVGWPFKPGQSSSSTRKPRLFEWTGDPAEATVETAVFFGGAIEQGIDTPGRKIAWILESPEIARWRHTIPFIEQNLDKVVSHYAAVLTSERSFCRLHPKIRYHPAGSNLPWIREDQYAIYRKHKLCSMFASNKEMVPAHRYRREVAERLKDKLDLFGGACGSPRIGGERTHPDKSDGLIPYMFQVVMENARVDFYYTEKLTNCFATGTVPIYWGSDCIAELFDVDGIIPFDDGFDMDSLSADLYYRMMPAIRNNLRLVRELEGSDDLLYRRYIRGHPAPREAGISAPEVGPPTDRRAGRAAPRPKGRLYTVPWYPWDPGVVLAAAHPGPASDESERLRIVTRREKRLVTTLAEVPENRVSIRDLTSSLAGPRSIDRPMGAVSFPRLNKAFLLHLPDAYIGDNVVFEPDRYYSMGRWWLGTRWQLYANTREVRHVDAAVSIGAWGGEAFQHFVFDALPPLAAVIDLIEHPDLAHLRIVSHNEPGHAAQWFWKRLGLTDRIVSKPRNAKAGFVIHADLVLFPQFEPNHNELGLYPRDILRPIQRRLGTLDPTERDLVVYLQRSNVRSVKNEDELLSRVRALLDRSGLSLHIFRGASSPGEAVEPMRRARIVFGPHGGAFANLIFAQPGTDVVEFVPFRRTIEQKPLDRLTMYYGLSQAAGLHYWFVKPKRFGHGDPGMIVDANDVTGILRRILE